MEPMKKGVFTNPSDKRFGCKALNGWTNVTGMLQAPEQHKRNVLKPGRLPYGPDVSQGLCPSGICKEFVCGIFFGLPDLCSP
jgi:hypothetical protein